MAENKEIIENFLRDKGLNDKAIAGVMGNIQQESNFSTTATNRSSGAYGLFQWTGSRKTGLENYAKSTGTSKDDIQTQLNYFWNELETTESKTKTMLFGANYSNASDYAQAFEQSFERSGGSALAKRKSYAETIYSTLSGGSNVSYDSSDIIGSTSASTVVTSPSISSSIGLEWWGDVVVVVFAILLIVMGVVFVGLSVTSNNTGMKLVSKIKGGGKSE
jgi:hypothetical protein